jgi:hypothetical protein
MNTHCSRPPIHVSLGAYGRTPHLVAIAEMLVSPPEEPLWGRLSTDHVQICPQNHGLFTVETAQQVRETFPGILWRLHANVRVRGVHRWADICDWPQERDYFREVARVSQALKAPTYTAHAGRRHEASLQEIFHYTRELEDVFGVPVGIEGHYPTHGNYWALSSWREYRALLESGVRYALDLSHLHILAIATNTWERNLVLEMLACDRCLEVHVSGNNGHADQHRQLTEESWWFQLLAYVHPNATVFSEGRQSVRKAQEVAA